MNFKGWIKSKKESLIVVTTIATMVLGTTIISSSVTASAATIDYYKVKVGNKVIAKVETNEEAKAIIEKVTDRYKVKGAKVLSVSTKPALTVEPAQYEKYGNKPNFNKNTKKVANKILTGSEKIKTIKVKDGDSVWSIARNNGVLVEKILNDNNMKEEDTIKAGDVLKLMDKEPLVKVTVVQEQTKEEVIKHETKEEETSDLEKGETKVKTEGKDGLKLVKAEITSVNGKAVSTKTLSSKITKEPVTEVVYKGTKEVEEQKATVGNNNSRQATSRSRSQGSYQRNAVKSTPTYNPPAGRSGSNVVSYALQWVGRTPYVYGGSSLTNGADCAGFVYRVLTDCGINVPYYGPAQWAGYGTGVSLSQARPGDVVVYPGHVSIYIGGGRVVHSTNPRNGTLVTPIDWGKRHTTIRRI